MPPGHEGNRHPGLSGFGQHRELLIHRIASTTLDGRKHFDSIEITGHSRMTRRTPRLLAMQLCPAQMGLLQPETCCQARLPISGPIRSRSLAFIAERALYNPLHLVIFKITDHLRWHQIQNYLRVCFLRVWAVERRTHSVEHRLQRARSDERFKQEEIQGSNRPCCRNIPHGVMESCSDLERQDEALIPCCSMM